MSTSIANPRYVSANPRHLTLHTSDPRRCTEVAQIVGDALNAEMVRDERLREKSYGVAEGRPQIWLNERFTPPTAVGDRMHHHEGIEGSETKHELARRVGEALADVLLAGSEHSVIVTHGFALIFAVTSWLRIDLHQLGYANFAATPRRHHGPEGGRPLPQPTWCDSTASSISVGPPLTGRSEDRDRGSSSEFPPARSNDVGVTLPVQQTRIQGPHTLHPHPRSP